MYLSENSCTALSEIIPKTYKFLPERQLMTWLKKKKTFWGQACDINDFLQGHFEMFTPVELKKPEFEIAKTEQ